MRTSIYYFTGTGNSLKIARDLASELDVPELISIPHTSDEEVIECRTDALGIVFPVYCFGIPMLVVDFIKKLSVTGETYVFCVADHGQRPGPAGTALQAKKLMRSQGIRLSGMFTVKMPNNYTPIFGLTREEEQKELFAKEEEKVRRIADTVRSRQDHYPYGPVLDAFVWLPYMVNRALMPFLRKEDKKFTVSGACTGCGTCVKACPVGNIELAGGRPVWLHNCQQCMSCFSLCPEQAILLGRKSLTSGRYRNPEIQVSDILDSNI